ncbi:hypothetical protein PVK06_035558 [Gossypium arboreum]|uniref:Uncharacterized protein n=1 Tax=Gossypium arboreum TaxID=29729 RepID=A0ABR0NH45_GOSAR|nr:hypothetical protein PVK06_035556 [Gossypium arboreum]KAK5794336.1 hypothetical protein PVK06_035558 [Gossypium arboreum]
MHPEKGFTLKESNDIDFMVRIRQVTEALNSKLFFFFRRIKVPITSNTINEFFELPDFDNNEYSSLMSNIESENLQEILEELTILGSKWTVSKHGVHTYRREYLTPLVKTIDVGKIILREMWNCAARRSGPTYFPFKITILCLKAKILVNIKKTGYSQGTITDWDLYRIAEDSVLQ